MDSGNLTAGEILDRKSILLLVSAILLMFMTFISSSRNISTGMMGNIIAFSSYLLFLGLFVLIVRTFELPKFSLLAFGVIYVVFIIGFVRDMTGLISHPSLYTYPVSDVQLLSHTADIVGYILASITLVFIIPKVIRRDWFFVTIVLISTCSILVGIPAYLIGDYSIFGVNVNTYTALEPFRQYGIRIPALASIWGDANAMSKISVAGLFGSHYLYARQKTNFRLLLLALHIFGLFLANSKMAIIAMVISYSVYFVYKSFGKTTTVIYLGISGVVGLIFFFFIIFGIGTNIFVPDSGFSGRISLWKASVATLFKHPILGIGIHNVGETISAYTGASSLAPQNSYLRIFVAGGVIGGGLYLWIIASSVFGYIEKIENDADLLTICLFITYILIQFTDTSHPFGVNKNALIFGVTLGFVIDRLYNPRNGPLSSR